MKSVNEKKIGKNAIGNITKLIVLQCVISDYSDSVYPAVVWPRASAGNEGGAPALATRSPGSRSGQVVGCTLAPAETRQAPLSDPQTETRNAAPATDIKRQ